jgi:hypothetical protein
MTRPSERELRNTVESLDDDSGTATDTSLLTVYEDSETGDWYAAPDDTEPVERGAVDPIMVIVAARDDENRLTPIE